MLWYAYIQSIQRSSKQNMIESWNKTMRPWLSNTEAVYTLEAGMVHVWRLTLGNLMSHSKACLAVLSDDEIRQAQAYGIKADKDCYVLTHGVLRYLLAAYTHAKPNTLLFERQVQGKPFLTKEQGRVQIDFNISHTHEYAVIAIGLSAVGIDIERVRGEINPLALAKRFFSQAEYQALSALPVCEQVNAFIYAWTIKEAWVKASGRGIADTFSHFEVNINTQEKPYVIQADDLNQFVCWPVNVAKQYHGTLVTSSQTYEVMYYDVGDSLFSCNRSLRR